MIESLLEYYKGRAYKWDEETLMLYFGIIMFVFILGVVAQCLPTTRTTLQSEKVNGYSKLKTVLIFLGFLVLWVFLGLRDVGTDLAMYRHIYSTPGAKHYLVTGMEPGYLFLNRVLYSLFPDKYWGIAILSALTLFFQYRAIINVSSQINVALAMLAIGCMFYLQEFNLMRIYLAANILLWGSKFIFRGEYKKYLLLNFLTIFIHFSSSLVFYPFALYYLWSKNKWIFWVISLISVVFAYMSLSILSMIPVFGRYVIYLENGAMKNSIGLMQYAINIPLFIFYIIAKKRLPSSRYLNMLLTYTIASLVIGLMSYKVEMLGRSLVYFNVVYVRCIPFLLYQMRRRQQRGAITMEIIYGFYLMFRLYNYLSEYLYLDGIMPYRMIDINI